MKKECKNKKYRSKNYIKYSYCTIKKQKIEYTDCNNCEHKEYKKTTALKNRAVKQRKRERNRFSIIYDDLSKCCVCGSKIGIEKNEIFEGAYRQISMKLGMVSPFCKIHHDLFHKNRLFNLEFKAKFQKKFMEAHSLEEFISIFKKDYIYLYEKEIKKEACF